MLGLILRGGGVDGVGMGLGGCFYEVVTRMGLAFLDQGTVGFLLLLLLAGEFPLRPRNLPCCLLIGWRDGGCVVRMRLYDQLGS